MRVDVVSLICTVNPSPEEKLHPLSFGTDSKNLTYSASLPVFCTQLHQS